ncbi:MAG: hypothetical protein PWP73_293, partial [Methanococcus sp.]|nr:hypothetical protein [Methanococcus sp.]
MDEQDILNELREYRNQDLKYEEGYILG